MMFNRLIQTSLFAALTTLVVGCTSTSTVGPGKQASPPAGTFTVSDSGYPEYDYWYADLNVVEREDGSFFFDFAVGGFETGAPGSKMGIRIFENMDGPVSLPGTYIIPHDVGAPRGPSEGIDEYYNQAHLSTTDHQFWVSSSESGADSTITIDSLVDGIVSGTWTLTLVQTHSNEAPVTFSGSFEGLVKPACRFSDYDTTTGVYSPTGVPLDDPKCAALLP